MVTLVNKIDHSISIIENAIQTYPRIGVGVSWGKDSMVLLHLIREVKPDIQVFSIITPFKPEVTLEFKDRIVKEWNLNIKVYQSKIEPIPRLWKIDPDKCCQIFKVDPAKEAVKNLDAWFAGLRKTEGRTRQDYEEWEKRGSLVKINPILEWTEVDIWKYSALYNVPQNPLYKQGYRSLGCAPCTSFIDDSELERAGRWIDTSKCGGECGIHTKTLRA